MSRSRRSRGSSRLRAGRGNAAGPPTDEDADQQRRALIETQIGHEEQAFFSTARIRDDGLIDPRQTRHVLGIALSASHSAPVQGSAEFGVFRM